MDKNSHIIEKNKAEWDGKVRFVAISLESEEDSKEIFVKKPEWEKFFEFYFMKDGRKNPAPSTYSVRYIPHYVIVGKDGKVKHLGSCSTIEQTINDLLNESNAGAVLEQVDAAENPFSAENSQNLQQFVAQEWNTEEITAFFKSLPKMTFSFNLSWTVEDLLTLENGQKVARGGKKPTLNIWARENALNHS